MSNVRRSLALSFAERYSGFVVTFVSTLILARLLTPTEIGIYSIVAVVVCLAHSIRDFGLGEYVVQERDLRSERLRTAFGVAIALLLTLVLPRNWIKTFSILVALLAGAAGIWVLVLFTLGGKTSETVNLLYIGNWLIYGIVIDKLSVLIGAALGVVSLLIVIYSTGYLTMENREHAETRVMRRFYFFLLLFIGSMAGLVFSSTLLGLLIFFELTGVCSWGLIGYYDNEKARKAALKAIITTQVASLGLYAATAYFFALTGGTDLNDLSSLPDSAKIIIFIGVLIAGYGKSAQLPQPFWLPDAMVAPTPISAYPDWVSPARAPRRLGARGAVRDRA